MALYLGDKKISKLYLGDAECKKAYLGDTLVFYSTPAKPSRLPDGYTEVEYIQFDSKSAINTKNYVTPSKLKLEIDMESTSVFSSGREYIVSNYPSPAGQSTKYNFVVDIYRTSDSDMVCCAGDQATTTNLIKFTANIPVGKRISLLYDGPSKKLTVGDATVTINPLTAQINRYPLNIGLQRYASSTLFSLKFKLYSAKLYSSSTSLQRDFVPCIDPSGVIGVYDLVKGAFYANDNTGTFTAGPAI